jgi:hypothetical protein
MLPRKYIIGKAWISYWPPKDLHIFSIDPLNVLGL